MSIPPQTTGKGKPADGRRMGSEVHKLLGDLFAAGLRTPSPNEIRRFIARHELVDRQEIMYRQAAKQRLITNTSVYLRLFALGNEWTLAGREVKLGGRRADLVWESASGVLVDEVKAGAVAHRFERDTLRAQVDELAAAAASEYGPRFIGVRAITLAAPRNSYLVRAGGTVEPIEWVGAR